MSLYAEMVAEICTHRKGSPVFVSTRFGAGHFSVRFLVYIVCPSVLSLNNLKLQKTKTQSSEKHFFEYKKN